MTKMREITDIKGLIAYGNEFIQQSARAKRRYEQQWLLNLANLAGDQHAYINRATGKLDRLKVEYDPDWMVRIVDNRVLPVYRTMVAKLTKNKPLPNATAHSQEEVDIQAARAAIKLLSYHWKQLDLDRIHPETVGWLVATGNAFHKQFWNEEKGEEIPVEINYEDGLKEDGSPKLINPGKSLHIGDTDLLLRTPFNIYSQVGKTRFKGMTIVADVEIMDAEEVYDIYGVEVAPEKDTELTIIQQGVTGIIDAGQIEGLDAANTVRVKELYILPCRRFPEGCMFRWAGDQSLLKSNKPGPCKKLPFTHFGLIFMPGRFWAKGIIDDIIPLQKRWNQLLSKIEMHNDLYNDPPTIIDPNVINPEDWTNEPGLVIESETPGMDVRAAAHVLEVPQLDPAIFKELEILDQQFEIVPVMNKVSFGKDTANATSGRAINFLQEKDDDVVRPLIDNIESGYGEDFERDFVICQENYSEDRGFAVVGPDNKTEWVDFARSNLEAGLTVGVEPGSAMPRSKTAQQALVLDMLHEGFFTDPRTGKPDFVKALKYMEFGSVDAVYEDAALDSNQAKRIIERLKTGEQVQPRNWYNLEVHVYEINRFRKTTAYEELAPDIQGLFDTYVMLCIQLMQPPAQPKLEQQPGAPSGEQVEAFLEILKQERPDIVAELANLTPEQRTQKALQLMAQYDSVQEAQPQQIA